MNSSHSKSSIPETPRHVVWGLVLSRKNSKRLPGKTMKPLAGKPMLAYTFEAALNTAALDQCWIFSDDPDALQLAETMGVNIPTFARPDSVSHDQASTEDTVRYFLSQFPPEELPDALVLLQATSPLRTSQDIEQAITLFLGHSTLTTDGLVSIYPPPKPLSWLYEHHPDTLTLNPLAHDSTNWKMPNGAIYILKPNDLLSGKGFLNGNVIGYEMPWQRSIDIDTIEDFLYAEALLTHRFLSHKEAQATPS